MDTREKEIFFGKWRRAAVGHAKEISHVDFLEDCVSFNIIPKFLRINNLTLRKKFPNEIVNFEKFILKKTLNQKKRNSFRLKSMKDFNRDKLKSLCDLDDFVVYKRRIDYCCKITKKKFEEKHRKKLHFWLKKVPPKNIENNQVEYINLTQTKLTAHEDAVLKLGPKFILNENIDIKDNIAKIETAITGLPEEIKNKIRTKAQEEIGKIRKQPKLQNKDRLDNKCLSRLKNKKDLTCLLTDKTNKICIMEREKYRELLEETIKKLEVEEVKVNPLNKLIEKTKDIIQNGFWADLKKPTIVNHTPIIPRIFGRYKDHKPIPALRPIVNRIEGPTRPLEIFMKNIYQRLLPPNDNSLSSTEQFIKKIREIEIDEKDTMVSFDVKDLFPSIDTKQMIPIINQLIDNHFDDSRVCITLKRINNLLLEQSYFQFNNKIFKQLKGVPMGSSISGIVAEIKLRLFEKGIVDFNKKFKLWVRYVDDVFCIVKRPYRPEEILHELNNIDRNIQFTYEKEENSIMNFLDVKLKRNLNTIETTIYRKPTSTNQIMDRKSNTPINFKLAALRTYIDRALLICSNQGLLKEEINLIKNMARKAGYNDKIVTNLVKQRIKKFENISPAQKQKTQFTSSIPYAQGVGVKVQKEALKNNIRIPIKPDHNIFQKIRNEKDKVDPLNTPGIYRISYKNSRNEENSYIGKTKRRIIQRGREHLADLKLNRNRTAICKDNLKDPINLETIAIKKIAPYNNHIYATHREAIEILTQNCCNEKDSVVLHQKWQQLLKSTTDEKDRETNHRAAGEMNEGDGALPVRVNSEPLKMLPRGSERPPA